MGVGSISPEHEVEAGRGFDGGGRSADPGVGVGGLKPVVDPFRARQMRLENLRPIGEALRIQARVVDGNEEIAKSKLDLNEYANGDGSGMWTDVRGEKHKALNTEGLSADEMDEILKTATEDFKARQAGRMKGLSNDVRAYVMTALGRDVQEFSGRYEELSTMTRLNEGMVRTEHAAVQDGAGLNSSTFEDLRADERMAACLASASGGDHDPEKDRLVRAGAIIDDYIRKSIERRSEAARSFVVNSGGLMSEEKALEKANAIYDGLALAMVRNLAEGGRYETANMFVERAQALGYDQEAQRRAKGLVERIKADNERKFAAEISASYDRNEEYVRKNLSTEEYVDELKSWANDENLKKVDPNRAARYARYAQAIETAQKDGVDPEMFHALPTEKQLQDRLFDDFYRVSVARALNVDPAKVGRMQFDVMQRYRVAQAYGFTDHDFGQRFDRMVNGELRAQTADALRRWYKEWGVHVETDQSGRPTKSELKDVGGEVVVPTAFGTPDGRNGTLSKAVLFEMTSSLVSELESNPSKYNDVEVVDRLMARIRGEGLTAAYDAEINATQEVMDIMAEVTGDIEASAVMRGLEEPGEIPGRAEALEPRMPRARAAARQALDMKRKANGKKMARREREKERQEMKKGPGRLSELGHPEALTF